MIYLDTSVVLAWLFAEDHRPPPSLWEEDLVASRLVEYEVWTRLHARDLERTHGDHARQAMGRLHWLELDRRVLERALRPFPVAVRTLDALHLASVLFLVERGADVRLHTYDRRMRTVADALGVPLYAAPA